MNTINKCPSCSQLPPPPPIFSIKPPPNLFSVEIRCSSHILSSSSSSSIQHKKAILSSSSSVSIVLGIIIALLISTGTIIFIKHRMMKLRQVRQRKYDSSSSIQSNRPRPDRNWTKILPLLNYSCSDDQTISTPSSDCPCSGMEPLLSNNIHHEYEQMRYNDISHYYDLFYCGQCNNYHQTLSSSLCHQKNFTQSYYHYECTCHLSKPNHLFELQPILRTNSHSLNYQASI